MVNDKELSLIKKAFRGITSDKENEQLYPISDIFIHISLNSGEMVLYNDAYDQMTSMVIYAWIKPDYNMPSESMILSIKYAIKELEVEEFWDGDAFCHPLNISIVDDEHNIIEELYFLDNDMVTFSEPLLSGYDDELDSFLKNLLS